LITVGLVIGLFSSFFLLNYGSTNTTQEKVELKSHVTMNLLIGLTLTTLGHTISRVGLDNQLLQLMPKS